MIPSMDKDEVSFYIHKIFQSYILLNFPTISLIICIRACNREIMQSKIFQLTPLKMTKTPKMNLSKIIFPVNVKNYSKKDRWVLMIPFQNKLPGKLVNLITFQTLEKSNLHIKFNLGDSFTWNGQLKIHWLYKNKARTHFRPFEVS